MIYTHSHIDHFGGLRGIASEDDLANGLRIIAPAGFLDAAVRENVIAGPAMARRAEYMFGGQLPRGPRGPRGCGNRRDHSARHAGAGGANGVDQPRRARSSRSTA